MKSKTFLFILVLVAGCTYSNLPTPKEKVAVSPSKDDTVVVANYAFSDLSKNNSFEESSIVCLLNDQVFFETSGMAASKTNQGMLYLEEDSGNPNQIQLIDQTCSIAGVYTIGKAGNRDWEDIALGPGPLANVSYVYVADIGDNNLAYSTKYVYRFPEPSLTGKILPVNEVITEFDVLQFQLPDGRFNAEALMVDPLTKDIYIVSKDISSSVYVATYPQDIAKTIMLKKIAILPFTKITAGDISPDGSELLLKTTSFICYWKRAGQESIQDMLTRAPMLLPYTIEQQGEAICFAPDGSGYYTTSERLDPSVDQPVYYYKRKK